MEKDTRKKLIEIAIPLFATKGFAAVSVRELTVTANTNVSAISYYFNGKEGLYQAVLEEQLSSIQQALESAKSSDHISALERLTYYAGQVAQIHTQRPFLARYISNEVANPTEHGGVVIERYLSQVYEFMQTSLQEGILNGDFRADLNTTYATISLVGILNFYFKSKSLINKFVSLPEDANIEYTTHAFQIYLHGIMNAKKEE